jgi:hypothetical protein
MTRTDLVMLWVWRNHARNLHIYSHVVASPQVIKRITNWSSHTRHNNSNNNSAMRYPLGLRASWIKKYIGSTISQGTTLMMNIMKTHNHLPLQQLHISYSFTQTDRWMYKPPPPPRGISWSLMQDPGARLFGIRKTHGARG